jgi:hypothetical protein
MIQRTAALIPPFLPPYLQPEDRDFPVVISERAAKRLYWHVINKSRSGSGLLLNCNSGIQDITYADTHDLDETQYWVSRFGRISIAVPWSEEALFKGFMLDIRSFPPGEPNIHLIEMREGLWPAASDPAFSRNLPIRLATRRYFLDPSLDWN